MGRRSFIFSAAASVFLSIAFAHADPLHLVAQGMTSDVDGAEIYSCLAYQGCSLTTYLEGTENRLLISTTKSLDEVEADLANCDLNGARLKSLQAENVDPDTQIGTLEAIELNQDSTPHPKQFDLPPVLLSNHRIQGVKALPKQITSLPLSLKIQIILEKLGIPTYGYKNQIKELKNTGALTSSDSKTITFGTYFDGEDKREELIAATVHEYSHAFQHEILKNCAGNTTFSTHSRRERAAYLQSAMISKYLDDSSLLNWAMTNAKRYTNEAKD